MKARSHSFLMILVLMVLMHIPLLADSDDGSARVEENSRFSGKIRSASGFILRVYTFCSGNRKEVDGFYDEIAFAPVNSANPSPTAPVVVTTVIDLRGKSVIAFPNPARREVRFISDQNFEKMNINIYNISGERVAELESVIPREIIWVADGIADGIYLYQVTLVIDGGEKKLPISKIAIRR